MKASGREPQRKSRKPVTRDVLERLLTTCDGLRAIDLRDRAILLVAFAAGGRRRSEVATLRHSQISLADPIKLRPSDPTSPTVPCVRIALGRTKTTTAGAGRLRLRGGTRGRSPAELDAGRRHHVRADLPGGSQGRLDRHGCADTTSVNLILKKRCRMAGLDAAEFTHMVCGPAL